MDAAALRVVLVDDERLVCEYLRTILERSGDVEVVGIEHDGAAGVEAVVRLTPDVVLMDLRMPGVDGIAAIDRLSRLGTRTRIVALTTFDADALVLRALRAGAHGFLLKSTPPEDLALLVRTAARGHTVMSPEATSGLVAAGAAQEHARARASRDLSALTRRESDVLRELASGRSNADIAVRLELSEATVKGYVSSVLDKLGCANRTQAGLLAHAAGLAEDWD